MWELYVTLKSELIQALQLIIKENVHCMIDQGYYY